MTLTDPAHVSAAKALRAAFQTRHEADRQHGGEDPLVRDLADYDRAFGIIDGQAG